MEEYSSSTLPPVRTCKILRRSIFIFLRNYQFFTSTAAILAFPFAASTLLAQALVNTPSSSPLLLTIHARLKSLFYAAGFPVPSEFISILNWKISQTISTSFFVLPVTLSFFLLAKGAIIQELRNSNTAMIFAYLPLVKTQLWNFLLIFCANATFFSIIFLAFNILDALGLNNSNSLLIISASSAVLYSIMLANTVIICNLALILSGSEMKGGYMSILRACILIKGRTATAMSLMVAINIAQAALEALFQYRILRAYYHSDTFPGLASEAILIAYLYAIVLVLETIIGFVFFQSCNSSCMKDVSAIVCSKTVDEFP
ncbi:hypothetical protein LIER_40789 [Lithospermum erythrorhizon]|uniref:Uncharacterized protein n=1 Tax=Lithospermum erythrorhizon TaxID=34254 RepID=A0AAV3R2W8_LITER